MADGSSHEVEWQFDAPDLEAVDHWLRAQPPHAALSLEERAAKRQQDTYFDTADWHLWHAGYSLRERLVGDTAQTTLKGLAGRGHGPVSRAEFTEPETLEAALPGTSPVAERIRLMRRGAPLRPLFTVTTYRRLWLARRGDTVLAELALDETTIAPPDGAAVSLRRVEIEEVSAGGLGEIAVFVAAIRAECALTPASASKFESGLAAAGLQPRPADLGATSVNAEDRAVDRAYAVLRRRTGEFLAREGGTALGEDVEQLHDMRVATRRLRAALRVFDTVLPPPLMAAREELRWFAQMLGAVRDLDVQIEHLEQLRGAAAWAEATALAPLVEQFTQQRVVAREQLLLALDSDRYARLVTALRSALIAGPAEAAAETTSREAARRIIRRRYRRFEADAGALRRDSPRIQFHELRIQAKRLRYSLEFFIDLYGRDGQRALVALRALQDLLGELQDLATTDARLRDLVRDLPGTLPADTLVMIGRLMERHEDRAAVIVRAFPAARAAVLREFGRLRRALRPPEAPVPPAEEDPPPPEPSPLPAETSVIVIASPRAGRLLPARAPGGTLQAFLRFLRSRRP